MKSHLSSARTTGTTYKDRWIRTLLAVDLNPQMTVLEEVRYSVWQDVEKRWIAELRKAGVRLTNITAGGDGHEAPLSEEHKAKLSAAFKGRVFSPETIAKNRASNLGQRRSEADRKKMSAGQKRRMENLSQEERSIYVDRMRAGLTPEIKALAQVRAKENWNRTPELQGHLTAQQRGRKRPGSSSQYSGVYHHLPGKWKAMITVNGKSRHLGVFTEEEEAARAWDCAARELYGSQVSRLNFPE
jgi:hypothetical protein